MTTPSPDSITSPFPNEAAEAKRYPNDYVYRFADYIYGDQIRRGDGSTYTYFVYDGSNPYLEITDPNTFSDGGASAYLSHYYLFGQSADQALASDDCNKAVDSLFKPATQPDSHVPSSTGPEPSGRCSPLGRPEAGLLH